MCIWLLWSVNVYNGIINFGCVKGYYKLWICIRLLKNLIVYKDIIICEYVKFYY